MTDFRSLRKLQLKLIDDMKAMGYEKLVNLPDCGRVDDKLIPKNIDFYIKKNILPSRIVSIVVEFYDSTPAILPPELVKLCGGKLTVERSGSVDGFNIDQYGNIQDMHDVGYDD